MPVRRRLHDSGGPFRPGRPFEPDPRPSVGTLSGRAARCPRLLSRRSSGLFPALAWGGPVLRGHPRGNGPPNRFRARLRAEADTPERPPVRRDAADNRGHAAGTDDPVRHSRGARGVGTVATADDLADGPVRRTMAAGLGQAAICPPLSRLCRCPRHGACRFAFGTAHAGRVDLRSCGGSSGAGGAGNPFGQRPVPPRLDRWSRLRFIRARPTRRHRSRIRPARGETL